MLGKYMRSLQNHPGIIIVGTLMIMLMIWGFWPKPIMIESTTVSKAPLTITIEEDGRTRVIDRYVIAAPVNGVTCRINLKVGDEVTQGQSLLGITPLAPQVLDARSRAQAKAKVSASEAALQAAKAQVKSISAAAKLANDDVQRYTPLLKKGLISQDTFDKAKTMALTSSADKRSAKFKEDVAKHELEAAKTTLAYSAAKPNMLVKEKVIVTSPIDGKVLKVARQCKGPVSTGEALLEVGDPSALEVEVDLLSADAVKIKPGMKVLFDRWGGDQPLEGLVRLVEPVGFTKVSALGVEEQRVLIISDFTSPFEQWQRLGDGYRVEARFLLWHEPQVLQVPSSSLFRYQNGWAVFAIIDGTAVRKVVTIGRRNGLKAQILSGLTEGDKIVNHPSETVEDGISIAERL